MVTYFGRGAIAAAAVLIGASSTAAAVLYDNGGLNGEVGNWNIGGAGALYAVSDSFTLAKASTMTGVDFGVWTVPSDVVSTVQWGIADASDPLGAGGFLYSGTATVMNGAASLNSLTWSISTDSFETGPINLGAGVYYLVLQNAVATNNDPVYWDETDGKSAAYSSAIGNLATKLVTGSEAFQILGMQDSSGTPEPASWALMLVGVAGIGAALRRAHLVRSPSA
jgi:hypothetical protein